MASSGKSLEEMLSSDVDESVFNALVGTLETQLDEHIHSKVNESNRQQSSTPNHVSLVKGHLCSDNNNIIDNNCNKSTISESSNILNVNNNGSNVTAAHVTHVNSPLTNSLSSAVSSINAITNVNSDSSAKRITVNAINSATIGASNNKTLLTLSPSPSLSTSLPSSGQSTPLLSSNVLPGALPASGYINQVTSQSSTPVVNAMPANQILQNAIKVTAMSNGNGSPLPPPSMTTMTTNVTPNRPLTTIALTAIPQSLMINKTSATGAKQSPTVLIASTKDGPMIVQPSVTQSSTNDVNNVSGGQTQGQTVYAITTRSVVPQSNTLSNSGGTGTGQNIVHHVVSNPNLLQIMNANASRVTQPGGVNIQHKTLAPRVVQLSTNLRLTHPQVIRQGTPVQGTLTLPPNFGRTGTILVRTENGQMQLINVGPQITPQSTGGAPGNLQGTTYRIQVPANAANAQTVVRHLGPQQQIVLPVSMANALQKTQQSQVQVNQPLTIQTTTANAQAATTPSQMSPNTAKKKCKNFLSTLIRLASDQPEHVATNVKNLIQGLIDDAIQPEDFTNQLQKELNSSPQPCLVPFLRKSLPYLRYSLMQGELTIEGVRAPQRGTVSLPQPQAIPQIQIAQTARSGITPTSVRLLTPLPAGLTLPVGAQGTVLTTQLTQSAAQRMPAPQAPHHKPLATSATSKSPAKSASKARSPAQSKEKKGYSHSLRDDDDINDVAAMGGVNLQEESQRILASNSEMVGQQIRSCKDENFLFTIPLHTRINKIVKKYGLDDASTEVVSLVSHAVQERLKTLVERLGVIAEHRQEQLKNDHRYEVIQDVKAQIQFLQELDRLEKRKHEEHEREMLMKAAKSRSKAEDPEQLRLKQRAKELQRQEMEELRQKEANETALQAIGNPWKKQKSSFNSSPLNASMGSSTITNNSLNSSASFFSSSSKPIKRVKRVSMRDLHFLMETERDTIRSTILYKAYAK